MKAENSKDCTICKEIKEPKVIWENSRRTHSVAYIKNGYVEIDAHYSGDKYFPGWHKYHDYGANFPVKLLKKLLDKSPGT